MRLRHTRLCAGLPPGNPARSRKPAILYYTGSNQSADSPNRTAHADETEPERGEARYGYRSLPLRLTDPARRFSITLLDDVRPANGHEDVPSAALLLQLKSHYPDLHVDAVAGDAGLGFDAFLHTVYAMCMPGASLTAAAIRPIKTRTNGPPAATMTMDARFASMAMP